jgi:adenylate kinase
MPTYIVLLGPPGAGKGTQAQAISQTLGLPHVSSGDIFRENLKNKTDLGKLAEGYMSRGELVPDDVTIAMIRERLSRPDAANGALLDGFPRTPAQAEALDKMLAEFGGQVDVVPYIKVPEDVLIERLSGRWTCRTSGHVFHEKYNPPKVPGVCDYDGSELYQREDDKAETVKNRIQVYFKQTEPLIQYYRQRGKLVEIDGTQPIEKVSSDLLAVLPEKKS